MLPATVINAYGHFEISRVKCGKEMETKMEILIQIIQPNKKKDDNSCLSSPFLIMKISFRLKCKYSLLDMFYQYFF